MNEGIHHQLSDSESKLTGSVDRCTKNVEMLTHIHDTIKDLIATRKQLATVSSMEEQTISVVRRLTDKWRENTEELSRLRETVENLAQSEIYMKRSFDAFHDRLSDMMRCPIREQPDTKEPPVTNPNA